MQLNFKNPNVLKLVIKKQKNKKSKKKVKIILANGKHL